MTDRSLAYGADNMPCVVYGGDNLYFSCWNPTIHKWVADRVDSSPMVGAYAALAFNQNSRPFISYYDAANGDLKLAYNLGSSWEFIVVDTGSAITTAGVTQQPVDQQIADSERSPELQALYDLIENVPWRDPLLAPGEQNDITAMGGVPDGFDVGQHTSIAIGSDGVVHISYYDVTNRDLRYASWSGVGAPVREVVDQYADQGGVGTWSSIAVDYLMRPNIAYMSEKYDDLKYARKKGGSWDKWTVDSTNNVGTFALFGIGSSGSAVHQLFGFFHL